MTEKMQLDIENVITWNMLLKNAVELILEQGNLQKFKQAFDEILTKLVKNEIVNGKSFLEEVDNIMENSKLSTLEDQADLQEKIKIHLKSIERCSECYWNEMNDVTNWFMKTCSQPHLLVWVKIIGYPYWPAKCFYDEGDSISVRFFGDLTQADVPVGCCFLYSQKTPIQRPKLKSWKSSEKSMQRVFDTAIKDVNVYIQNITSKFGAFNYANFKTPLIVASYSKHIEDMIAGATSKCTIQQQPTFKPSTKLHFEMSEGSGIVKSIDHDIAEIMGSFPESHQSDCEYYDTKRKVILTERERTKLEMILQSNYGPNSTSSATQNFYSSSIINVTRTIPKLPACAVANKALFEKEKIRFLNNELKKEKRKHEEYRQLKKILANKRKEYKLVVKTIDEASDKMCCIVCLKEGKLFCCSNTSYCDESCQRKHWNDHMMNCTR